MASDETRGRPDGTVAEVKEKGEELVSTAQEQISTKAQELGGEAKFQIREQLDQRSTETGEHVQSIGKVLHSSANQLRSEGNDIPAKIVEEVARRADDLGNYLRSAQADRILDDIETFGRRRPWITAGVGALAGFVASRFLKASGDRRYEEPRSNGRGYGQGYSASPQRSLTAGRG
jgi:ElaB/YqjD/DUF883 family membrane-anchored ribosome-binding protein